MELEELAESFEQYHGEVKGIAEGVSGVNERMDELEKALNRPGFGAGPERFKSAGERFVEHENFKNLQQPGRRRAAVAMDRKALLLSTNTGNMPSVQREADAVPFPRRNLVLRDLLGSASTTANSIEYTRQTGFTNNADMVAEGALKPESDIAFTPVSENIRTIAHWIPASVQVLSDAGQLMSLIDSELRFGLQEVIEDQLLAGDGTGENLNGIIPQATAFDNTGNPDASKLGQLAWAARQAELAKLPATGIVLNITDWWEMVLSKDGDGNYIMGPPNSQAARRLWSLPVASSLAIAAGTFLVGAFSTAATVYSREEATVEASNEDQDNFTRNKVTILAEERLALAVRRPEAFVTGPFV